jgi:hypothetical protein
MKSIKGLLPLLLICLFAGSCQEDFLDLAPQDELSVSSTFSSYNNVKIYSWSFYEFFETYAGNNIHNTEIDGDLIHNSNNTGSAYIWGRVLVPTNDGNWTDTYANIRKVNLLLDNIPNSEMAEADIAHWRAVGLFFRAHEYFRLLKRFGGVPWLENTVLDTDTDILYGPRDSRDVVASNMLRDLLEAEANIKVNGDGPNTLNKSAVKALISRFGLFEGTWRKYHGLSNHEQYLEASISASASLLGEFPNLHSSYDQMYNSEDLDGVAGVILYQHFVVDVLTHRSSTNTRSTNNKFDITRKGIDMFLMKDGQTRWNSPLFQGDRDAYAEFRDRDTRLLINTPPPYKVNGNGSVGNWTMTADPADAEYFPILKAITGGFPFKELPDRNWSDRATGAVPNFTLLTPTQTSSGYRLWKIFNDHNNRVSSRDVNDFPIFRIGGIMVNYAEAMFEMDRFDQGVADATINLLRTRGEVAPLVVADLTADFDPTRDVDTPPLLWEIRRERAIELMADGYRRDDLRRWKKMAYASEPKLGRWILQSDYNINIPIQGDAPEGYVQYVPGTPPQFPDYYYLFPLPSDELVLNPNLEQNPGW